MIDSLWQVLFSVSLVFISIEQAKLRREVSKCLRILYAAAESVPADQEGGVPDA